MGTIVALSFGYGLAGLVFVVLGANLVGLFGTHLIARKIYPALKIWPFTLAKTRLKELFGYGIPAAITSTAVKIIAQTDIIVVSACIGFGAAGVYTAGANLINYSSILTSQISTTFFPPVQRAVARGEMGEARWLFIRQVRLGLIFGLPIYLGFIMFGHDFIHLWLYDSQKFPASEVSTAALVLSILSAAYLSMAFRSGAESLLAAMGYIRFTAGLAITQALLNLSM
ncbi:MAG: oligosaccharide flippase family protein, partial [Oscillochloris sp.]|nr:oligosaccharide flippase family protein [Oscillochloris sp.]